MALPELLCRSSGSVDMLKMCCLCLIVVICSSLIGGCTTKPYKMLHDLSVLDIGSGQKTVLFRELQVKSGVPAILCSVALNKEKLQVI